MKKPRVLVENSGFKLCMTSESGGTRTLDPRIKSPLLYRLSYALMCAGFATKKQVHFPEHHFGLLRY